MKFTLLAITSTLLGSALAAEKAVVQNGCRETIYVQSYPQDGSAPGELATLKTGETYTEDRLDSGSTIKIDLTKSLTSPLLFGYSSSDNPSTAYYEFSSKFGNPFLPRVNTLDAGDGCDEFDCGRNEADCYSTPAAPRVLSCPEPVTLTAFICAPA